MESELLGFSITSLAAERAVFGRVPDWVSDILEFQGPPSAHCFGATYVTLTQFGLKGQGDCIVPDGVEPHWVSEQAIFHFKQAFWEWLSGTGGCSQIAWRSPPILTREQNGSYVVRCRLAAF